MRRCFCFKFNKRFLVGLALNAAVISYGFIYYKCLGRHAPTSVEQNYLQTVFKPTTQNGGQSVRWSTRNVTRRPNVTWSSRNVTRRPNVTWSSHNVTRRPSVSSSDVAKFKPKLTSQEVAVYLDLVDLFSVTLTRARVPFFLYSGSLLGSWRHHGMVPWDDDVDFAVPYVMRENVSTLLGSLQPRYYLDKRERVRFKFYSNSSYPTKKTWRWPFLDISFYIESDSEVYDSDTKFKKVFSFRKQDVFPLTGRPFSGRLLPAPRDSLAVLKKNYDLEHCATGWYSHKKEAVLGAEETGGHPCESLKEFFPFVNRVGVVGAGCNESLVVNGTVVSWFFARNVSCS